MNNTEAEFTLCNSPTAPHDNTSQELEIGSQQLPSQSLHSPESLLQVRSSSASSQREMPQSEGIRHLGSKN